MLLDEIVFGVPLLLGSLLVLGSALGLTSGGSSLEVEADAEGLAEPDGLASALGLGRVPLGVVIMLLTLQFGAVGMVSFGLFSRWLGPGAALSSAWLLATLLSLVGTRLGSRLLARMLPSVESYASTKHEIVGETGTVLIVLGPHEVVLKVLDRGGAELRVRGLTKRASVGRGTAVVLTRYEPTRDAYYVEALTPTRD